MQGADLASQDIFSDQGYADSSATSYCSTLRSEAEDYYWEHGRRYHGWGGGRYLLPNDDVRFIIGMIPKASVTYQCLPYSKSSTVKI